MREYCERFLSPDEQRETESLRAFETDDAAMPLLKDWYSYLRAHHARALRPAETFLGDRARATFDGWVAPYRAVLMPTKAASEWLLRDLLARLATQCRRADLSEMRARIAEDDLTHARERERLTRVHARNLEATLAKWNIPARLRNRLARAWGRWFRIRRQVLALEPYADISGGPDAYVSDSGDPQFRLVPSKGKIPWGWCRLRYTAELQGCNVRPVIYVDQGDGFTESSRVQLLYPTGKPQETFVALPPAVALRLDPCDCVAQFRFTAIEVTEFGKFRWPGWHWRDRSAARRARSRGCCARSFRPYACSAARGGRGFATASSETSFGPTTMPPGRPRSARRTKASSRCIGGARTGCAKGR